MAGDDWVSLIWAVVVIMALASSLAARRLPLGQLAKLAAGWIAIIGVLFMLSVFKDDMLAVGRRILGAAQPDRPVAVGETVQVRKGIDGHFWIRATVDGVPVRFLVDSGATMTAVSQATVAAAHLQSGGWAPDGVVNTANGPIRVSRVVIGRLEAGSIVRHDLGAVTAPAFGAMNVLGMNFLSSLRSWTVRGDTLVLEP